MVLCLFTFYFNYITSVISIHFLFQNLKPPILLCFHGLSYRSRILFKADVSGDTVFWCQLKIYKRKILIFVFSWIKSHCDINTCINLWFFFTVRFVGFFPSHYISCFIYFSNNFSTLLMETYLIGLISCVEPFPPCRHFFSINFA